MLKYSTTELSASPEAFPLENPATHPRGAGRRDRDLLAGRQAGRRAGRRAGRQAGAAGPRPPPPLRRAGAEGRSPAHLRAQLPGAAGAGQRSRCCRCRGAGQFPPRRARRSGPAQAAARRGGREREAGRRGRSGRRRRQPRSTGSRPAARGGRRQEAERCRSARGTAPLRGVGEGPRAPGPAGTAGPAVVTATAPPRGGGGALPRRSSGAAIGLRAASARTGGALGRPAVRRGPPPPLAGRQRSPPRLAGARCQSGGAPRAPGCRPRDAG